MMQVTWAKAPPLRWGGADLSRSFCQCLSESVDSSSQPSLPFRSFKLFCQVWWSGKYFSTDLRFQSDGARWQLPTGVVPAHGIAMDTSLPWLEVLRAPVPNLKAPVPKLIY